MPSLQKKTFKLQLATWFFKELKTKINKKKIIFPFKAIKLHFDYLKLSSHSV